MNRREIAELKKALKPETCCLTDIAVYYVGKEHGVSLLERNKFALVEEEKAMKYLDLSKKSLSGKLGKNLIELEASDPCGDAIASGEFRNVFHDPSDENLEAACSLIQDTYVSETDYCILFLYGTYDVPCSNKSGDEFLGSDDVYSFMQCILVPVKLSKPGLAVNLNKGRVMPRELFHELEAPRYAFLYPAFSDRVSDAGHVMFYTKNAKDRPEMLLDRFLHAGIPSSPDSQQSAFCKAIEAGFGGKVPFDAARGVYEALAQRAAEAQDAADIMTVTLEDLVMVMKREADYNGLVFDGQAAEKAAAESGVSSFVVDNIVPAALTLETDGLTVKVPKDNVYRLERRVIDGIDYYLIPAAGSMLENVETAGKNEIRKK